MFKFRNGAIKSFISSNAFSKVSLFQFRHGAIKRIKIGILGFALRYFNSDMVRLRDE